jgi:hypothetical protein
VRDFKFYGKGKRLIDEHKIDQHDISRELSPPSSLLSFVRRLYGLIG